ncbi:MAG TPA: hypothetical protein VF023_00525 [Bryobacteraceae bacterium]|jgi:hypothetical protein
MATDNSDRGGFFGFIDVLHGLPVIPKIIMFLALLALISGFFSGPFSVVRNAKISAGIGLFFGSLGWRAWEDARWTHPSPPHKRHWDFHKTLAGLLWFGIAAFLFVLTYRASP